MRIKLRTNIGSGETDIQPPLLSGQEREVDEAFGRRLVARGLAVDVTPEPAPKRELKLEAVPPKPAIANVEPAAIEAEKPMKPAETKPVETKPVETPAVEPAKEPAANDAEKPKPSPPTRRDKNPKADKES